MRGKEKNPMEMKRLEKDIESVFQRVAKIDPFDVAAYRALATVEIFGKYVLFRRMNKIIVFIILNSEIYLIVWKLKTN